MSSFNFTREIHLTVYGGIFLLVFGSIFVGQNVINIFVLLQDGNIFSAFENVVFLLLASALLYGAWIYIITRIGNLRRFQLYKPISQETLITYAYKRIAKEVPTLTVLIPSYKEEKTTNLMTLYSAALLEYPHKHIVLLIDDSPLPSHETDKQSLIDARELPNLIQEVLDERRGYVERAYHAFQERCRDNNFDIIHELAQVANVYQDIAEWFLDMSTQFSAKNHIEHFFSNRIYKEGFERYTQSAYYLRSIGFTVSQADARQLIEVYYARAIGQFSASVMSFERKKYTNLSHEPNKAMNLNSYIGLMGGSYEAVVSDNMVLLEESDTSHASYNVPLTDYIITLDADSIFSYDYALRLIYLMEQDVYKKTAVIQTPYNTYPCPFNTLEYVAGATTDIQYLIHQGFVSYQAAFWVGANALLRTAALHDIVEEDIERGFPIKRYIQDRTVIEDTESSIDLVHKGWEIFNYPANLAHSATPPDFGSLLIQRRRWANGGVIIFPKLLSYFFFGKKTWKQKIMEVSVRAHYLLSIMFVNVGLLIMFVYPFEGNFHVIYLMLSSIPYFLFYMRDLARLGYRYTDLFRVYALNLILLPVNIGGVLKSLQQGLFRTKIPFGRTPKIQGHTVVPRGYLIAELVLVGYLFFAVFVDTHAGRYGSALFSLVNATFIAYAIWRFIGFRNIYSDLVRGK